MPDTQKPKAITIRIPDELWKRVKVRAIQQEMTFSEFVAGLIADGMKQQKGRAA